MQYPDVRQHKFQIVFIVAGIAIVVIVLGVAGSLLNKIDERLREDAVKQVTELTQQAASNAADHIYLTENAIEAFTIQTADFEDVRPALKNLKDNFSFIEVAFVDINGVGRCADDSPYTADKSFYDDISATSGQLTYTAPYVADNGEYAYHAMKPVHVGEELVGELHVDVPIDMLISNKQFHVFESEGFFILFDAQTGIVSMEPSCPDMPTLQRGTSLYDFLNEAQQASTEGESAEEALHAQNLGYVEELQRAVADGETDLFVGMIANEKSYVCVAPIGISNAYVGSIIPESSVRSEIETVTMAFEIVFGIVLVCLLAMLVMSFFFYRKRMEEKGLEMKTHLYGALSDSLDMAVNMYSPDDAVVTPIVAKAREIIGYPMAEFMGNKRIADKIDLSEEGRIMLSRIRNGQIATLEQGIFSLKDRRTGELRWVSFSVTPFYYENKRQLLVVFRDSTHEKNLQLTMKDAMVAAETANQAKSDFLSRMSHEIRTPMNAIIGMTQIAGNHIGDPQKVQSSLGKIMMASDHLLSLINDVLDISKIESGKMILANEEFSFSELIENVAMVINTQAMQKKQTFTMEVSKLIEDRFMGDKMRMQQILINLLSNSVKYTPEKGHIRFEVRQKQSTVRRYIQVTFTISDDGIGMSPEYQEHIFEPFVMEGRSITQGTGLGMPIVKNILTMINGDIQIESEIDKGTTFTVVVNLERASTVSGRKSNECGTSSVQDQAAIDDSDRAGGTRASFDTPVDDAEGGSNGIEASSLADHGQGSADSTGDRSEGLPAARVSEHATGQTDFSAIRVLLAEDNELNAEIAKELLVDFGLTVDWAHNGKQVCTLFEASEPGYYDVILMDIQMPLMNGYEATKHIRALSRTDAQSIPIIAMSANAFMDDIQASLRVGMNDHLSKPIDIRLVLATIAAQVGQ